MSRLPLRARVVLASVVALALGIGLLSVAINLLLANRLSDDAASVLHARADVQLAAVELRDGRVTVREGPQDAVLDRQAWVFVRGRALEQPVAPPAVERAAARLSRVRRPTERDAGDAVRLLAKPAYGFHGRRQIATVVVGLSLTPYQHTERIALVGTAALALFVLLAGAAVAWRAVTAGLRPVALMSRRAGDWSEHDLDRRFDIGPARDELTGLAATLDHMLARIAASRRREQRFSAEMAHELRTPLTGVRAEVELALRPGRGEAELRTALERVLAGTERMSSVIEILLAVARGETENGAGSADAVAAARAAVKLAEDVAHRRGIRLELTAPAAPVRVGTDGELIAQALQPLLDNALRHARERVELSVAAGGERVRISVTDDGPGIAAKDAEAIFEPGRGGADGGAGLGLALSRRLARACGGEVYAEPNAAGGAFVLVLPGITAVTASTRPGPEARRTAG